MTLRITEADLETANLKFVSEVLVSAPHETESGISVYRLEVLATFTHPQAEAKISPNQQLVVVVDDPDNPETQDRICFKAQQRFRATSQLRDGV